jgi:magnesium chelatase family protein
MSLAHHGILFLDELLEFRRHVVESLRQPMEDGRVVIARAAIAVSFPARFTLVGAMNPCPCGNAGDPARACTCGAADIAKYRARLSGPMRDRVDMHVPVGALSLATLASGGTGERSEHIRERVELARTRQHVRYGSRDESAVNAHVSARLLQENGELSAEARRRLTSAAERLGLTARGYHRVLRVARTIADLDGARGVDEPHVAEALCYRTTGALATTPVSLAAR